MPLPLSHTQLLRYAGLFTWAMVGIALIVSWYDPMVEAGEHLGPAPHMLTATVAYFAFGLAYGRVTHDLATRQPRWYDRLWLVVLTVSAIAVSQFTGTGLGGILLMIIAGVIPWLMPLTAGIGWVVLQHAALVPVFIKGLNFTPIEAMLQAALYMGYSSFTFVTGLVAKQQAQAREKQRQLNAELRATRALLAESSRISERLRISRELHDLLGHHLTALSLNLEVAGHLTEGKALEHVKQSHTLAKLLLTDVREAVSEMREERGIDLTRALQALAEGVPVLDVQLDLPEQLQIQDPERAQVLLRCAQEIITNTLRHAGARHLSVRVRQSASELHLAAYDDGHGSERLLIGNGLHGIGERLSAYGGRVDIKTAPGKGFALDIRLPLGTIS